MKPFQPAKMDLPPVREFLADLMRHGVTRAEAKKVYRQMLSDKCYLNDVYQVNVSELPDGMTHLSIKRIDKAPVHDWRDLQSIKNALTAPEREAVEIYPAESRKVDTANQYHLWVLPAGVEIPFGFSVRAVTDSPGFKAVQRPGSEVSTIEQE